MWPFSSGNVQRRAGFQKSGCRGDWSVRANELSLESLLKPKVMHKRAPSPKGGPAAFAGGHAEAEVEEMTPKGPCSYMVYTWALK